MGFLLFSRFRTELMGYAILGVLVAHFLLYTEREMHIINLISRLIYTQGFLFLSGFGLYYSYSKDSNIWHFYKKRINRLYIPFILISFIFLISHVLRHSENVVDFFAYITTIAFWYKGNYYGVWYVAVSLLLYFVYPFMHKFIFGKNLMILLKCFVLIAIMFTLFGVIYVFYPDSWKNIGEWISKTPMFPLGMIVGYFASKSFSFSTLKFMGYVIMMLVLLVVAKHIPHTHELIKMIKVLIGMPLICLSLNGVSEIKYFTWILSCLKWLGKYSLEIYLLHLFIYWSWYDIYPMNETLRYIVTIAVSLILCVPVHNIIINLQCRKLYFLR